MATKRRRGAGTWEFKITRSKLLPRPVYLTFDNEAEGDAYCRRLEQLLDRGIVPPELSKPVRERGTRLRKVMVEYRDTQAVSNQDTDVLKVLLDADLKRLPPSLELREVTFQWATEWVTALKREANLSPTRIRHYVGALARCLDWVAARGDIPFNPLRLLPRGYATYTAADAEHVAAAGGEAKEDTERDRRLQEGEEEAIRAILAGARPEGRQRKLELQEGPALLVMFDLALETCMRMSELYTLEVPQLDFKQRTIFLERSKNGDKRQIPMTTVAQRVLRKHVGKRGTGLVFPWWSGDRGRAELKRCTSLLSRQYTRIFEAAGCQDLGFHDLRHEAISRLFERTNLTDVEIAKITGHRDPRQLKRYANLRGSTLAARLW